MSTILRSFIIAFATMASRSCIAAKVGNIRASERFLQSSNAAVSNAAASNSAVTSAASAAGVRGGGIVPLYSGNPPNYAPLAPSTTSSLQIKYHGGPVLMGPVNVYYIWYGSWTGNSAVFILETLMKNIGGSDYYKIQSTYTDGNNVPLNHTINFVKSVYSTNGYKKGVTISQSFIQQDISTLISKGSLPRDSNAVYFYLTSVDVKLTNFCSKYCGWHSYFVNGGTTLKYSFVGNPGTQCPKGCVPSANWAKSPNNNIGADGMASVIAHELEETHTDPLLNAWYFDNGNENADQCAWNFGPLSTAANGAKYNVNFGGLKFLIQQNWVNKGSNGGNCSMTFY